MLDQASTLLDSILKDRISDLLDESFKGLNGAGYDFGSLLDSSSTIVGDANAVADLTRTLVDDSRPLLEGQAQSADAIRTWARSVAGVTAQLEANDPQVRTILDRGNQSPLDDDREAALGELIEKEARRLGVPELPLL